MLPKRIVILMLVFFYSCSSGEAPKQEEVVEVDSVETNPKDSALLADIKTYHKHNSLKVVTGFHSPESVATDGTYYYVSNVGRELMPSEKDQDGFISRLDGEGNVLDLKWIENLDAPKGMAILNEMIYTADVDKLRGFEIATQKKVMELDFNRYGTSFLNDLTIVDDVTLLVSATDIGYVFKVDLRGKGAYEILEIYGDMTGVNGLHYDAPNNRLLMAGFGIEGEPVGAIMEALLDKEPTKQKQVGTYQGFLDGIQLIRNDRILFSDWRDFEKGGQLMIYDMKSKKNQAALPDIIKGPADFYYSDKTNMLWLPAMAENELIITRLELD